MLKKNHLYRIFLSLSFLLAGFVGFAQDVIIKKNGDKIYCRVLGEDSLNVYYLRKPQKTTFELNKSEIESVYLSKPLKSKPTKTEALNVPEEKKELMSFIFSGGLALPIGEFGNKDLMNAGAGFAKNGGMFRAAANVKLSKYFGALLSFHYQTHGFDTNLFDQQEGTANPGVAFSTQSTSWKMSGIYAGINLTLPFRDTPQWFMDVNLSEGFAICTIPELQTTATYQGNTLIIIQRSSTTWAPSFMAGLGFHYMIKKGLGINFGANFMTAKPAYSGLSTVTSNGNVSYDNYTQKIMTLNAYVGLTVLVF